MAKLLLADDSPTIQRVIELTFSGEDIEVVAVGDGEQAIARIPTERPDIVLADIAMPKRSGYEVAAFVKGHPEFQHIPVLLLAGAFEPVDDEKAEEAGCDGVLVKPFEPQHVVARVRELLEGVRGSPTQAAAANVARPAARLTGNQGARDDGYFDRLDTAFATRGGAAASTSIDDGDSRREVPTLDQVLSSPAAVPPIDLPVHNAPVALPPLSLTIAAPPVEPPETPAAMAPGVSETLATPEARASSSTYGASSSADVVSGPTHVASGFGRGDDHRTVIADAFTALLALEQGEPGVKPVRLTTGGEEPVISDALVDEVARRVLQRLAPETARAVIVEVVSEIAERLVREEIARIRSRQ